MADAWNIVSGTGALLAAGFAGFSWWEAHRSAGSARTSANAADATVELQRAEVARTRERVDIVWEMNRKSRGAGQVVLTNTGTTTAHDVDVVVTINGDRLPGHADALAPTDTIVIDATEQQDASERAFAARERSFRAPDMVILSVPRWKVSARITWVSELGTPGVQVID